ncbi:hypothetical protein OBBRIDRAFT_799071, partial [Obba rivulosa]
GPKLYAHLHQCRRQGAPVHPCSQHPRRPRDHLRGMPLQDWLGLARKSPSTPSCRSSSAAS